MITLITCGLKKIVIKKLWAISNHFFFSPRNPGGEAYYLKAPFATELTPQAHWKCTQHLTCWSSQLREMRYQLTSKETTRPKAWRNTESPAEMDGLMEECFLSKLKDKHCQKKMHILQALTIPCLQLYEVGWRQQITQVFLQLGHWI